MSKLQDLLDKFKNDTSWNTPNSTGGHRFDKQIAWIESMIKSYAKSFNMTEDEVTDILEKNRNYSWPNYYQEANFPEINSEHIIGIYETMEDFQKEATIKWKGFKCPQCGDISQNPQECIHRIKNDKKCNWCSYGLISNQNGIIIKEYGLKRIPIFDPIPIT